MPKSTTFLNYMAFLSLYIMGFIIIYIKNTEIIGFYYLLVVNTACVLYNISYFTGVEEMLLIPQTISFSITISTIFHTICLIFVIMMISAMRVKYSDTYGTPINLPPKYQEQLDLFKKLMISTFSICGLILLFFAIYYQKININIDSYMANSINVLTNPFPVIVLLISCAPLILSSINVSITNDFSRITRKDLMR